MNLSRRDFIKSTAAYATSFAFGASFSYGAEKLVPIAVQVYSVREEAEKDLGGTLKRLAEMGYKGVEFAGTYGHSAEEVAGMLSESGLSCISTHLGLSDLLGERFNETAAYNKAIGNSNLVVAGGLGEILSENGGNQFAAYLFNELAIKARQAECRIGFHAHQGDFTDLGDGETGWDLFFSRIDPAVIAEMDIGNCLSCGADPYRAMEKTPGRGTLIHLKSSQPDAILCGEGDEVDWPRAFQICETTAGTEWYIVEQEGRPEGMSPMDAVARCLENLRKMGKC